MGCFLYYLPESTSGLTLAALVERGLGYAFEAGREISKREVTTGPGATPKPGGLVSHCPAGSLLYLPDKQVWRRVPGTEAWVGHDKASLPGPDDLARGELLDGHHVRLGDGRLWQVPAARRIAEVDDTIAQYSGVPRVIDWDAEGKRVYGDVVPAYRALWAAACGWFDAKLGVDTDAERAEILEASVAEEYALAGLAANYRLWKPEAGLLSLLTDTTEVNVLDALIDWPSWEKFLKKKQAAATSNTEPGVSADSPDTGQR